MVVVRRRRSCARWKGTLQFALQLRLSRGPLSDEQVNAVAAAIDRAATSVEQT